jgi:hypothetical protein
MKLERLFIGVNHVKTKMLMNIREKNSKVYLV